MSELNYKASNIAKAEREFNANFFETLEGLGKDVPSISSLLLLLRAGGLTEDEADVLIDEAGIKDSLSEAVTALGKAGFLAKLQSQAKAQKAELEEAKTLIPQVLQNTGNETKVWPSQSVYT